MQDLFLGLLFLNLLAAKVLNRNLIELDALDVFGDFLLDFFGGRVILKRELDRKSTRLNSSHRT